ARWAASPRVSTIAPPVRRRRAGSLPNCARRPVCPVCGRPATSGGHHPAVPPPHPGNPWVVRRGNESFRPRVAWVWGSGGGAEEGEALVAAADELVGVAVEPPLEDRRVDRPDVDGGDEVAGRVEG